MTDNNEQQSNEASVFMIEGDYHCEKEGCGESFLASPPPGDEPVLFNTECPEHGMGVVVFHFKCMPAEFKAALDLFQKRENAQWN